VLIWLLSTAPRLQVRANVLDGELGTILGWDAVFFYSLVLFLALTWTMQKQLSVAKGPR
jgi:hypothetical protein